MNYGPELLPCFSFSEMNNNSFQINPIGTTLGTIVKMLALISRGRPETRLAKVDASPKYEARMILAGDRTSVSGKNIKST